VIVRHCIDRHPFLVPSTCAVCRGFVPQHEWGVSHEPSAVRARSLPCIHLGEATGEAVLCQTCSGSVKIKTFACSIHGTCTMGKRVPDVPGCCDSSCEQREAK